MFSFLKKPKKLYEVSDSITDCTKKLLIYRMKKDSIIRDKLIANGGNPEAVEETIDALNPKELSSTTEYYIVYLIAIFIKLQRKSEGQYSYQDIVYTIDQRLPKPKGHIPVQMWSPKDYSEYVKYRLTIDFGDSLYPRFVIDDLFKDIYSDLLKNFHSKENFQL